MMRQLDEGQLFNLLVNCTVHPPVRLPPGYLAFARAIERAHGITPSPIAGEAPSNADAILRELVEADKAWSALHPVHRLHEVEKGETRLAAAWKAARAYAAGAALPLRTWQHEETGRITETAERPGPRWAEVPATAGVPGTDGGKSNG